MPSQRIARSAPEAPFGERPYRGWTWRGADLTDRQLSFFIPGKIVKHLGIPALRIGKPRRWPVCFAVYVHDGWRRGLKIALPADACFEVWAVLPIPDGGTSVVLEQIGEEACVRSSFRRSLERWLKHYVGSLPEPNEPDRQKQGQPFAQWLPESRAGEAPLEGPVYDFEDAVRYASAWSDIEEGLAWRILASLERFLELAGIAQVDEDEDLKREREEAAAWLPEQPNLVDGRAESYAEWVTGIDHTTISAVRRGEMAYLDHLGLVSWDCEAEREARLGAPAWAMAGTSAPARADGR